jgi:protein-tyrosine phosphatase
VTGDPDTAHGREVGWDGFHNARDLGDLPTLDGRRTRRGALYRSATLRFVTDAGWREAYDAGVRTIIDLRNDDEVRPGAPDLTAQGGTASLPPDQRETVAPPGMTRVWVPLDDVEDVEFWRGLNRDGLNGTPLYFTPFLRAKPARCATAVTAVARAAPGGVVFHCGGGRDRTGLVALLLLSLAGVQPAAIADDYELTTDGVRRLSALVGHDDSAAVARALAERGTTARAAVLDTLSGLDAGAYLRGAGVSGPDLDAVRERLLG